MGCSIRKTQVDELTTNKYGVGCSYNKSSFDKRFLPEFKLGYCFFTQVTLCTPVLLSNCVR